MPAILNTRHEQSVFWMIVEGQENGAIIHHDVCHGVLITLYTEKHYRQQLDQGLGVLALFLERVATKCI